MSNALSDNWKHWISNNRSAISDGFEQDFVIKILSNISSITPEDVRPQYPFEDSTKRNRRIDFVIQNKNKGYFLAIELDGARRGADELQAQWSDFLQRQNDLLEKVGPLLRFSNSQMFKNPHSIIERINTTLNIQNKQHIEFENLKMRQIATNNEIQKLKELLNDSCNQRDDIIRKQYEQKLIVLRQVDKELHENEINSLNFAQLETQRNLIGTVKENKIMLRILYFLTAIVVTSMGVILYSSLITSRMVENTKDLVPAPYIKQTAKIEAINIAQYINKEVIACGRLMQEKKYSKGVYLNLDRLYPEQSLSIIVWNENLESIENRHGKISQLLNKRLCVSGLVNKYRNHYQIIVKKADSLFVYHK